MSILGYDPARYHTGRAPIEAAALGLRLAPDQVAYRCNLVTVGDDGTMVDFAGGHPSTEDAAEVIARPRRASSGGDGVVVPPRRPVPPHHGGARPTGPTPSARRRTTSSDKPAVWPTGPAAAEAHRRSWTRPRAVVGALRASPPTRSGCGARARSRSCRRSASATGVEAGLSPPSTSSAASACSPACDVVEVAGATGWYDTDYEGKRDAALAGAGRRRRPVPHPRRGHRRGRPRRRPRREGRGARDWDRRILAGLVDGPRRPGAVAAAAAARPPHAGARCKTHTTDSVPYLLVDSATDGPGGVYTEPATAGCRAGARPRAHGAVSSPTTGAVVDGIGWRTRSRLPTFLPDRSLSTVVELSRGHRAHR